MDLKGYFKTFPRGAKRQLAESLGITPTWLGLLISKKRKPSATLAKAIEKATKKMVSAKKLRPDLFG